MTLIFSCFSIYIPQHCLFKQFLYIFCLNLKAKQSSYKEVKQICKECKLLRAYMFLCIVNIEICVMVCVNLFQRKLHILSILYLIRIGLKVPETIF